MKDNAYLWSYVAQFCLKLEMFQVVDVMKIKTHFMFNDFFFENLVVYEIMWKNTVQSDVPQMKIWRTCVLCWMTEATKKHAQNTQHM